MHKVSFIGQLIEFNKRVLDQGTVNPNANYTMKDLKRLLFFNRVFISNMDEMFWKYDIKKFSNSYIEMLKIYNTNISWIKNHMRRIDNTIQFNTESTFESRLVCVTTLKDQIMSTTYSDEGLDQLRKYSYQFDDGKIYYVTYKDMIDGRFSISFIDTERSSYNEVLKYDKNGVSVYIHNIDAIIEYIQRCSDIRDGWTVAVKITRSKHGNYSINRVECSGDINNNISYILKKLFPNALILRNRYIYTDDIMRIIDSKIISAPIVKQKYHPIDLEDIFNCDRLIEYPKCSFDEYLDLLNSAAEDDNVQQISLTLYRIGSDPTIYYILKKARSNGIHVYVNIELRASGEDVNYMWFKEMEEIGVHVTCHDTSGKVHSKLTLIKFKNGKYIAQIGTGNYHTKTTSQYTDLSLITADEDICLQITKVFQILIGMEYTLDNKIIFTKDLLVSRHNLRSELNTLIRKQAEKEHEGYISIKCNSLDDDEIINELDNAANKGCKIDLIVRGVCTWIPEQLGKTVTIKSIIWDKLEHSRVYCFGSSNPVIYIGSLDPVTHKIDNRIETLVQIKDPDVSVRICKYMSKYITNTRNSWIQTSSGMYIKEV